MIWEILGRLSPSRRRGGRRNLRRNMGELAIVSWMKERRPTKENPLEKWRTVRMKRVVGGNSARVLLFDLDLVVADAGRAFW